MGLIKDCFQGQAYIISLCIVLDIMTKQRPVVFLGYELTCFLNTKVTYLLIVIMLTDKLCPDSFRDEGEALVMQYAVDVLPIIFDQLFCPKFVSVFVFILQLLQPQAYTTNNIGLGSVFLVGYSKIVKAKVKRRFYKWELDASMIKQKGWNLLSWHWSVNAANNEKFSHCQLRAHLFYPGFSGESSTKHLRLYLPYSGNS